MVGAAVEVERHARDRQLGISVPVDLLQRERRAVERVGHRDLGGGGVELAALGRLLDRHDALGRLLDRHDAIDADHDRKVRHGDMARGHHSLVNLVLSRLEAHDPASAFASASLAITVLHSNGDSAILIARPRSDLLASAIRDLQRHAVELRIGGNARTASALDLVKRQARRSVGKVALIILSVIPTGNGPVDLFHAVGIHLAVLVGLGQSRKLVGPGAIFILAPRGRSITQGASGIGNLDKLLAATRNLSIQIELNTAGRRFKRRSKPRAPVIPSLSTGNCGRQQRVHIALNPFF